MRDGIRIARLFGIDVLVDWSWAFIVLLMTWNVSAVFAHWHPDWGTFGAFALGLTASLLFFLSVLLHELAHALVAISQNMGVRSIRLFLFGGVSNIEREPPSAMAELLMAAVGPAVSLGIGINLMILNWLLLPTIDPAAPFETISRLGPLQTVLLWLGPINVMVGVFNLIPGFPLDGGRILRAALWAAWGDLERATYWAASIGRGVGWGFVVLGIALFFGAHLPFFGGGPVSGLWLAFIGWFLATAAQRSYEAQRIQEALEGVTVSQLMRRDVPSVPPSTSASALVDQWFLRSGDHAYPVVDGDRFVGLVCPGDVRKIPPPEWPTTPVSSIMTPADRLATVAPNEDASSALRKLANLEVEQLPVVWNDALCGMLEHRNVARWLELRIGPPRGWRPSHAQ
jgi:Zn-dependent protease